MNYLDKLQREAEIANAINAVASIALLALLIWGVVAAIRMLARWEQREDAKVKALQRIAAKLPEAAPHHLHSMF